MSDAAATGDARRGWARGRRTRKLSGALEWPLQAEAAGAAAPWGCSQVGSVEAGDDGAFVQSTFQVSGVRGGTKVGVHEVSGVWSGTKVVVQVSGVRGGTKVNPAKAEDGAMFIFDEALGLGACGDWIAGPRANDAYLSGIGMGKRLLNQLKSN
eukprot:gene22531-27191_t